MPKQDAVIHPGPGHYLGLVYRPTKVLGPQV
jgi:hypothetical protein